MYIYIYTYIYMYIFEYLSISKVARLKSCTTVVRSPFSALLATHLSSNKARHLQILLEWQIFTERLTLWLTST